MCTFDNNKGLWLKKEVREGRKWHTACDTSFPQWWHFDRLEQSKLKQRHEEDLSKQIEMCVVLCLFISTFVRLAMLCLSFWQGHMVFHCYEENFSKCKWKQWSSSWGNPKQLAGCYNPSTNRHPQYFVLHFHYLYLFGFEFAPSLPLSVCPEVNLCG